MGTRVTACYTAAWSYRGRNRVQHANGPVPLLSIFGSPHLRSPKLLLRNVERKLSMLQVLASAPNSQ